MVTIYSGYTRVIGQMELHTFFEQIRSNLFRQKVEEIERALAEEDFAKAERIKRQLTYFTLTANYAQCRLPHSLTAYNDAQILDFDKMQREDIPRLRKLAEADRSTLACALSPRRHGLKLLVCLRTEPAERLRKALQEKGKVTYAELEDYHKQMFELCVQHYEALLQNEVDTSGSDLARGMYATYDPQAFFSQQRVDWMPPFAVELALPSPEESVPQKRLVKQQLEPPVPLPVPAPAPGLPAAEAWKSINPLLQLEYRRAQDYTRRKFRFEPNSRDSFVYCLGNQCYIRHIPEEDALRMILHDYGNEPDFDASLPLRNAYLYTNKSDAQEEEQRKPLALKVMDFLKQHYVFRRNVVLDTLEFCPLSTSSPSAFTSMRGKDFNTIYTQLQLSSVYCSLAMLKAVIDSDFAKDFDPFTDYFLSLPSWDGVTDYIGQLAATVKADDPVFWKESLRRWLVGLVACALDDDMQNQQMLLLYSKQGKGKSRFIRNLLPGELSAYYRNGMINPDNKDHMLALSNCLIINLEEFDGVSDSRLADLKRIITQDKVTERKVYDTQSHTFIRRASFVASTNNPHCLQDIGENRRMLFNSIHEIDYRIRVNHAGIYSQALALYRSGFQYWYENEEISFLNTRNEQFRQKEPIEENLFFYFRAAKGSDVQARWLPAAYLLSVLCMNGRMQSNKQVQQVLVTVLEKNGFRQRVTRDGVTEYWVTEYSAEERTANAVRPDMAKQAEILY